MQSLQNLSAKQNKILRLFEKFLSFFFNSARTFDNGFVVPQYFTKGYGFIF